MKSIRAIKDRKDFIGIALLILGVILQLRQFLVDRSLWLDEAMLVNNVTSHTVRFLLTKPLDSDQASPAVFLLGLKLLGRLFNYRDIFLRLLPLAFGCALLLAAFLLKERFTHPITRYLFLGMLAFCPVLIYYSSEVKSYIADTCVTVLLLFVALNYRRWRYGHLLLGVCGVLAIFTSIPSVFVLAAIGILAAIQALHRRDWPEVKRLGGVGLAWLAVFALDYVFSLRNVAHNTSLNSYWVGGFAPLPASLPALKWYLDSLLSLAALGFARPIPVPVVDYASWYAPLNCAVLAILLVGAIFLYRRDRHWFWLNALVICFVLLASFLKIYPFRSRPILFLVPVAFTFLCALVDGLLAFSARKVRVLGALVAAFIFCLVFIPGVQLFLNPTHIEDIKGVLAFIQAHDAPTDKLAISHWSYPAFDFYSRTYQLQDFERTAEVPSSNDGEAFLSGLCANHQAGRIWVIFSHRFSERTGFLASLAKRAPLELRWEGPDSGAYLFDFFPASACK